MWWSHQVRQVAVHLYGVVMQDKPKSLLSCKSFESTREMVELARWMGILAEELAQRCAEDERVNRRRARTLGERAQRLQRLWYEKY